jgi:hypothetical protein
MARVLILLALISVLQAASASAQIISTIQPAFGGGAGGGGARTTSVHAMIGPAIWEFGGLDELQLFLEGEGGSLTGGQRGLIVAADVSQSIGGGISVGGGGWINTVSDQVRDVNIFFPNFPGGYTETVHRRVYSFYGNLFWRRVGVQAGVVPFRGSFDIFDPVNLVAYRGDIDQTDMNVFAIGRFGASGDRPGRWAVTVGGGLYRYGTRKVYLVDTPPESTASNVGSGFVNGSIFLYRGLSLDMSLWYTAADNNPDGALGNASQTRFTVGVGFGR